MKKLLALAVLVLSLLVLPLSAFVKEASWYKCLKGNIGGYPVTLQLHKYTDQVTGYYYYDKYMMPLVVYGSAKGDSLSLAAYVNTIDAEHFRGILKNGVYSGYWSVGGDSSDLGFSMKEDAKLSGMFEFVYVKGEKDLFRNFEKSPDAT